MSILLVYIPASNLFIAKDTPIAESCAVLAYSLAEGYSAEEADLAEEAEEADLAEEAEEADLAAPLDPCLNAFAEAADFSALSRSVWISVVCFDLLSFSSLAIEKYFFSFSLSSVMLLRNICCPNTCLANSESRPPTSFTTCCSFLTDEGFCLFS